MTFVQYFTTNRKLLDIDNDMLALAMKYNISDAKSITYYGLDGLVKRQPNGLYLGTYYYGNDDTYVAISFSIRIDRKNVYDSDVMITRGMIVKNDEIIVKEDWRN